MKQAALMMACAMEDREQIISLLLAHPKIDVNVKAANDLTALKIVFKKVLAGKCMQSFKLLMSNKSLDVNTKGNTNNDYTALHHAVEEDQPKTVKALLKVSKILVNAKTKSNETPLILAAQRNNPLC